MERFIGGLVLTLQILLGLGIGVIGIWCVVIGFTGGRYPFPWEWHTNGSVLEGLLWIFIGLPVMEGVIITGLSWLGTLLALPFALRAERRAEQTE